MPIITVPKPLREKLGDDGADALVDLVNQSGQNQKEDVLEFVAEKFERRLSEEGNNLREEIHANSVAIQEIRTELVDRIEKTRADLIDRIEKVNTNLVDRIESTNNNLEKTRSDLIDRIEKSNANLIKWVFAFWVGQVGVIVGVLFAFFK